MYEMNDISTTVTRYSRECLDELVKYSNLYDFFFFLFNALVLFSCCNSKEKKNLQVELWDITSARKIVTLPQTCSANTTNHRTKKKGLFSLF